MANFNLRKAEPKDVADILRLIKVSFVICTFDHPQIITVFGKWDNCDEC